MEDYIIWNRCKINHYKYDINIHLLFENESLSNYAHGKTIYKISKLLFTFENLLIKHATNFDYITFLQHGAVMSKHLLTTHTHYTTAVGIACNWTNRREKYQLRSHFKCLGLLIHST